MFYCSKRKVIHAVNVMFMEILACKICSLYVDPKSFRFYCFGMKPLSFDICNSQTTLKAVIIMNLWTYLDLFSSSQCRFYQFATSTWYMFVYLHWIDIIHQILLGKLSLLLCL